MLIRRRHNDKERDREGERKLLRRVDQPPPKNKIKLHKEIMRLIRKPKDINSRNILPEIYEKMKRLGLQKTNFKKLA